MIDWGLKATLDEFKYAWSSLHEWGEREKKALFSELGRNEPWEFFLLLFWVKALEWNEFSCFASNSATFIVEMPSMKSKRRERRCKHIKAFVWEMKMFRR